MPLEFGYNCAHYLPTLSKCRKLIDSYRERRDLLEQKWLSAREVLTYLDETGDRICTRIASGEIKIKRQKDGKLLFGVRVPAQYDDWYNANSGGVCLYYQPHSGLKISCIEDIRKLHVNHPNAQMIPSDDVVETLEAAVLTRINPSAPLDEVSP